MLDVSRINGGSCRRPKPRCEYRRTADPGLPISLKPKGFTLLEMSIVAAIGAVISLGMVRLLRTFVVDMQQQQQRLGEEQLAQDALDPLIELLKGTDPATIVLLSPDNASWAGIRFTAKKHI